MAARLRKTHQEDIKTKIQGSQLVNFLQKHALDGDEANSTRIDAAKFLLNKIISNPPTEIDQKTHLSGGVEIATRPKLTKEEWLAAHGLGTAGRATE